MQYIKKQNTPPTKWEEWFKYTDGNGNIVRSFDYGNDERKLVNLPKAKSFLLAEQHGLCAYCQQKLTDNTASIEHLIPKSHNKELSTNYYNLVAVCKNPPEDKYTGRLHCDKERGNQLLPLLIFYENIQSFFDAGTDGIVRAKKRGDTDWKQEQQIDAFIEILNLNHDLLKKDRAEHLRKTEDHFRFIDNAQKRLRIEYEYKRLSANEGIPFRQFLLICLSRKLGKN